MQKKLLIIIIFTFLTAMLGVFMAADSASAEQVSACPANCAGGNPPPVWDSNSANPKRFIRLQVYIPGVTHSCAYKANEFDNQTGQIKKVDKKCYYIESNLPLYIRRIYSFSIGVIAIIAVLMIMIGGLRWIFAAGNTAAIGAARQQIGAAVAGLILALSSYVILNTINPSLTKLQMTMPGKVGRIEQGTLWCSSFPEYHDNQKKEPMYFCEEGHWGESNKCVSGVRFAGEHRTKCGIKYQFGYQAFPSGKFIELGKGQVCFGNKCNNEKQFCYYPPYGVSAPFCSDAEKMCSEYSHKNEAGAKESGYYTANRRSKCDDFDRILQEQNSNYVCGKRFDKAVWYNFATLSQGDECALGKELRCPYGYERVSCLESDKCSFVDSKSGTRYPKACNYSDNNVAKFFESMIKSKDQICIDPPARGAKGVNAICCKWKGQASLGVKEYICEENLTVP